MASAVRIGVSYYLDALVVTWMEVDGWRIDFPISDQPPTVAGRVGPGPMHSQIPPHITVVHEATAFSPKHEVVLA